MNPIKKAIRIIPSSIIFFLLVPLFSLLFGRKLDAFLGLRLHAGLNIIGTISIGLLVAGGYYVIEPIRILFAKGKGIPLEDIFPEEQTTELITTGIYAQTRNPMIFGYLLCVTSVGQLLESASIAFIIPSGFIILWTIWLKTREEPALETRFGDSYLEYKKNTPYLVPRPWRR